MKINAKKIEIEGVKELRINIVTGYDGINIMLQSYNEKAPELGFVTISNRRLSYDDIFSYNGFNLNKEDNNNDIIDTTTYIDLIDNENDSEIEEITNNIIGKKIEELLMEYYYRSNIKSRIEKIINKYDMVSTNKYEES